MKEELKILVTNFSGNVGKSVVAREIFAGVEDAHLVEVESYNEGSKDFNIEGYDLYNGDMYEEILDSILEYDKLVIDVGASNVISFTQNALTQVHDFFEDIDFFVVPAVPDSKQTEDTVKTVRYIIEEIGADPKQIKILFNKFDDSKTLNSQFEHLIDAFEEAKANGLKYDISNAGKDNLLLPNLPMLDELFKTKTLTREILNGTDWKSEIKKASKAGNKDKKEHAKAMYIKDKQVRKIVEYREKILEHFYGKPTKTTKASAE